MSDKNVGWVIRIGRYSRKRIAGTQRVHDRELYRQDRSNRESFETMEVLRLGRPWTSRPFGIVLFEEGIGSGP